MKQLSTSYVAEHMLQTGKLYSAAELAFELGTNTKVASAKLFNIRVTKKYECEIKPAPNRKVRVIAIDGVSVSKNALWDFVLFSRPINSGLIL
ncbi:hypothetical protein [Shewanella subflava]|uniref:Uncharacterized protein n=1 Tax=Shewanella subflava TaxID=2986476 RepID=A0ABT3I5P3_9GAMM|nr:hypothetical protein [Shewanella subflava]MCW3171390.1 hypothetical protein [Shewanella subflava]